MATSLRSTLDQRWTALKNERDSSWLAHWQDINRYTMPRVGRFMVTDRNKGDRRNQAILNETATFAVNTAVRGLMYGITNPARPWISLQTPYPDINKRQNVKIYLETLRDRMLEVFRRSNLYTVLPATYRDLLLYGTHACAVNKDPESIIRLEPLPLGSYALATSGTQRVEVMYREFQRTRAQLVDRYGLENCTPTIQAAVKGDQNLDNWEDVRHAVEPNPNHDPKSPFAKDFRFRSLTWMPAADDGKFLSVSGCKTFPILAPRWDVQDGDAYGFSPLMDVFGTVKGIQKLEKESLSILDKIGRPPLNVPVSLKHTPVTQLPGGINFVNDTENAAISAIFQIGGESLGHLGAWREEYRQRINSALFVDIFLLLAGNQRDMTATEVQARVEEKVQTLGPIMLRLNDELLDPLVERTFEIMADPEFPGLIPEAPEELQDMPLNVEYVSDVHKAMKMSGVGTIERTVMFLTNLASSQMALGMQPTALDKINIDETADIYSDLTGSPAKMINDADAVAAIRQTRSEQQAKQEQMQKVAAAAQVAEQLGTTPADPDSLLGQMGNEG
jgi:hypothetical protein